MKTLKIKILPGIIFLMTALSLIVTSCAKEKILDLRDEITGQYSYTVKIYAEDGTDLVYIGDQGDNYDITGTMKVIKNSADQSTVDFFDGSDLMFQGTNIKDAGNAIVFDIPDQEAYIGPTKVLIAGYRYWDVNSSSYDGAYLYADKSVEIAFTVRIMNADTGLVMILTAFR